MSEVAPDMRFNIGLPGFYYSSLTDTLYKIVKKSFLQYVEDKSIFFYR